jgi:hypothetical protein
MRRGIRQASKRPLPFPPQSRLRLLLEIQNPRDIPGSDVSCLFYLDMCSDETYMPVGSRTHLTQVPDEAA